MIPNGKTNRLLQVALAIGVLSLGYGAYARMKPAPKPPIAEAPTPAGREKATFAAGCFWSMEAIFKQLKGVDKAEPGYAGGKTANPSYDQVETGDTGHAESLNIVFDPKVISYRQLLNVLLTTRDPTTPNKQGPDEGTQYRSVLFYRNDAEKQKATTYMKHLQDAGKYKKSLAVQSMPLNKFWKAEEYHQDYIVKNPGSGYVNMVSIPEIKKTQKEFPQLVKEGHKF